MNRSNVNGTKKHDRSEICYHPAFDTGGAEGMDEIFPATDGLVIAANGNILEGYDDLPG